MSAEWQDRGTARQIGISRPGILAEKGPSGGAEEEHRPLARGLAGGASEEEHRPLAQGGSAERQRRCTGRWHGDRSATRVYRRRKGGAAAEGEKLRPMARGRPTGRQRRSSGCERKAGRRNIRGGAPADGTGPADGAAEKELRLRAQGGSAEQQRRCGRQRRSSGCERKAGQRNGGEGADGGGAPADGTPGSGTKKGLRCRRPVSGGPDYIIYYRFCSPRIRIATSRIVVSSNVTTPPSGPGSK